MLTDGPCKTKSEAILKLITNFRTTSEQVHPEDVRTKINKLEDYLMANENVIQDSGRKRKRKFRKSIKNLRLKLQIEQNEKKKELRLLKSPGLKAYEKLLEKLIQDLMSDEIGVIAKLR